MKVSARVQKDKIEPERADEDLSGSHEAGAAAELPLLRAYASDFAQGYVG
jgi:hypothetical protein